MNIKIMHCLQSSLTNASFLGFNTQQSYRYSTKSLSIELTSYPSFDNSEAISKAK